MSGGIIKHTDIVEPGNPVKDWIEGFEELKRVSLATMTSMENKMKEMYSQISSSSTNTHEGQSGIKSLSKGIAEQTSEYKKLESQLKSVTAAYEKMTGLISSDNDKMRNSVAKVALEWKKGLNTEMLASAKRVMAELTKEITEQTSAQKSLNTQRQKALEGIARQEQKEKELRAAMLLQGNTIDELKAKNNALMAVRNKVDLSTRQGKKEYDQLTNSIRQNNTELKRHDAAIGNHQRNVGNYVSAIRTAWMGYVAAFAGVYYAAKRWVMMNAELSDSMAAVRRTTGMTQQEVYGLNERLRGLTTRTAQASLLDLAHVAGKLGIAKNEIFGFVKAADMIGVALGKDLGNNEEAINQLGRIVKIFKIDANDVGMERALLKVGSALKDLGNASVAEEANIIDFTKRLGGIAMAAGISVDKVMGLAATYDLLGQTMEVSSTATSQIWIAMVQKTEKFAKIAGMSVKDFTDLMKKDFNEAFIAFVEGLSKNKGGMEELGEYFKGLGLDGRRIIGVMTVLSSHVQDYRDQMKLSKESLDAGTTAAEQFAIQNDTLAASIDKATKAFNNFIANSGTLSFMTGLVKNLTDQFQSMSDRLSNDPLVRMKNELADLDETKFGAPHDRIKWLRETIKAIEDARSDEEKYNAILKEANRLLGQNIELLKERYSLGEGETPFYWEKPMGSKMAGVPEAPPPGSNLTKVKAYADMNDDEKKAYDKAVEEEKKRREAYYQFLLKLGMLTIDQIVKHEKDALIESGAWGKSKELERLAWMKQARIDAENVVNKRTLELLELHYDELIGEAKRNGEDTYGIERQKIEDLMRLHKNDVDEYRKYKEQLLNLDDSYADKTLKRWEKFYGDLDSVRNSNTQKGFENKLADVKNKIQGIDNKKEKGGKGKSPVDLSPEDISERQNLVDQYNQILKEQADFEIAQIQRKIDAYDKLIVRMMATDPNNPRLQGYQAARSGLELDKEKVNIDLAGKTEKGNESQSDAAGLRSFDNFFEPEQWQKDMQKIVGEVSKFVDQVNGLLNTISANYQMNMESDLSAVEERYAREYEALDEGVRNKTMSERTAADKKIALEKKQKTEQAKIEKEYREKQRDIAVIQAIINTAMAVTMALSGSPPPLNFVLAALTAAAGIAEIAVISSQKFAKGGSGEVNSKGIILSGKRHSQGGVQIPGIGEAEQGEYFAIINRGATAKYRNELPELFSAINEGRVDQLFDRRGMPSVNVNVNDRYGKGIYDTLNKPKNETKEFHEGNFTVYQTGNYRHRINNQ